MRPQGGSGTVGAEPARAVSARTAWLREARTALRASRTLAMRLEQTGRSSRELALIRLRIDHALLEVSFLMASAAEG